MTTFSSANVNEVSVQEKCKNKMHRSRFDNNVNFCQHDVRGRRTRALSRIPTTQIKSVLPKGENVLIEVQKPIRKVVPHSSKLHADLKCI